MAERQGITFMKYIVFFTLCAALTACSNAQKADEVQATYVPSGAYNGYSCRELSIEADRIIASTPQLAAAVEKEYQKDKGAELVAWVLFWPAAFAMDGNAREVRELANVKGRLEAIRTKMKINKC